ncbi:hypothetical protein HY967_01750 [Candidatus Jorgensenbacteria bacterium]|nr:hypothetical protein [Candidatus Jorgensenbacteria bacterium]
MEYSAKVGDFIIIFITAMAHKYIAEVTQENPLRLKVQEDGPLANLQGEDFVILTRVTREFQKNPKETVQQAKDSGKPFVSGLKCFGITDRHLYEIVLVRPCPKCRSIRFNGWKCSDCQYEISEKAKKAHGRVLYEDEAAEIRKKLDLE